MIVKNDLEIKVLVNSDDSELESKIQSGSEVRSVHVHNILFPVPREGLALC